MLKTHVLRPLSVLSSRGKIEYKRYSLIPKDKLSKEKLFVLNGQKSIVPLDSYLGLAGLPFKITPRLMLEIAFWAQNQGSYQRAEEIIAKVMSITINDDTLRQVTNMIGTLVFEEDCLKANIAYNTLFSGKINFAKQRNGTVYILTDGAALNTRLKNEDGSTWRENKLGEVFSSDGIRFWIDSKGKRQHKIEKKEYVSYVGSVEEFKKHLLACALRGGYGQYNNTVLISDGATWIRNMTSEIFPDAQQILDFYHLCENVNEYARFFLKKDEAKIKPWAKSICDKLRKSQFQAVLAELETHPSKKPTGCPVNLYGYITNNINNIDYLKYEKQGLFIGSGAIESGNKIVLQDRLKRAGMRWNTSTAQAMLTLRAKHESGLWYDDVERPFLFDCLKRSLAL
jgi:hypothetical protein